jgi:cytochrome c2
MKCVRTIVSLGVGMAMAGLVLTSAVSAASGAAAGDPVKGEKVFATLKCNMCHNIAPAGKKMGPDLAGVGTRRDAAWLMKYLPNPKGVDPKNKMPAAKATGQDLDDLVAYLGTLKAK